MKGNYHRRVFPRPLARRRSRLLPTPLLLLLLPVAIGLLITAIAPLTQAQSDQGVQTQEDQLIREFSPPSAPPPAPVYEPAPAPAAPAPVYEEPAPAPAAPDPIAAPPAPEPAAGQPAPPPAERAADRPTPPAQPAKPPANNLPLSQYVLEFNRSPVVGNSLRLRGTYAEGRIGFTRPRNWDLKTVQAIVRFQHSPALIGNKSNLTVRVNGTSVGSTPLNRKQSQIGEVLVTIPPNIIQNYNELTVVAQQNNSATCSDPADQALWTEVLPDSKLLFGFQPKAIPLDFSRYPYPFLDELSLDANQLAYLLPKQTTESWLTSAARFQADMGRLADFRPLETKLVRRLEEVPANQKLVIIGTPTDQPSLKALRLPYPIVNNQFVDGSKAALPEDVGLVMLATSRNNGVPVLVITGNGAVGVAKAAQFLIQPENRKLGTGAAVLVDQINEVSSPSARQWPRYLPDRDTFKLSDLKAEDDKPFQDVTVRGSFAPTVAVNFRALPDDRFKRGSSMTLSYSYGPQVNPRLSTVEVRLDEVPIGGQRLTSETGAMRETLNVNLPENLITSNSKLEVAFNMKPREVGDCGRISDQQLWGTVHSDSQFNLKRENVVKLPDLQLMQAGYPFAAPQDLSTTAIALPDKPSDSELQTLMEFSERLGRLSRSEAIKLQVFTITTLPEDVRREANLVGIGNRDRFPFPEVFDSKGFKLGGAFARQDNNSRIQTAPDTAGVIKQVISPWNGKRVLMALTAQTDSGMDKLRALFQKDSLFFQLKADTAVINTTDRQPSEYDPDAYAIEFFQEANQTRQLDNTSPLGRASRFLQDNWYLLPTGIILAALALYGIVQLYLKRLTTPGDQKP